MGGVVGWWVGGWMGRVIGGWVGDWMCSVVVAKVMGAAGWLWAGGPAGAMPAPCTHAQTPAPCSASNPCAPPPSPSILQPHPGDMSRPNAIRGCLSLRIPPAPPPAQEASADGKLPATFLSPDPDPCTTHALNCTLARPNFQRISPQPPMVSRPCTALWYCAHVLHCGTAGDMYRPNVIRVGSEQVNPAVRERWVGQMVEGYETMEQGTWQRRWVLASYWYSSSLAPGAAASVPGLARWWRHTKERPGDRAPGSGGGWRLGAVQHLSTRRSVSWRGALAPCRSGAFWLGP